MSTTNENTTVSVADATLLATKVNTSAVDAVSARCAGAASYGDISDVAERTVERVLMELAWTRRQRDEAAAKNAAMTVTLGEAHHARVKAERSLATAKRAFKVSIAALSQD